MTKWTLPEGKLYTQAEMDAAVAAALREAQALVRQHIYYDSAGSGFAEDAFDDAMLALTPDGGKALDRALAAEREAGKREMLDLYERVEKEGGCGETAMRMSIRAQGET